MALLVVFLIAAGVAVAGNTDGFKGSVSDIGAGPMALSALLALGGVLAIGGTWLSLARGAGLQAPALDALALFFASQMGKYVPGAIWPVVAQMEFGRRWNAPRRVLFATYALLLLVLTATGLALGLVLLPLSGTRSSYWWVWLLLPAVVVCLHPRVVPALLNRGLVFLGRERLEVCLAPSVLAMAVGWALVAWTLLGLHVHVLVAALGESGGRTLAAAVGGLALGWAAGLLVVFSPAGLGVRDSILVATFAGHLGGASALAVAVASRVLLLLVDLALAGLGFLVTARSPRPG